MRQTAFFVCDVIQSWLLWEPRRGQQMGGGVCVCVCVSVFMCVHLFIFNGDGWLGGFLGIFNFHSFKCEKIENFIKRMWQIIIM